MTEAEIERVRATADVLMSVGGRVADHFYAHLFEIAPAARGLFAEDLTAQKFKLADTLAAMVSFMADPARLEGLARDLGRRHAAFGAEPEHYGPVGEALLASLGTVLGARFTPEVRDAWASLYGDVSRAMIAGQAASPPA